ncbi:MAG TPA: DUF58 domain-containing protein [Aliidongia sp.]|nr:DUF58 domain-containing protein [Aliidongia sp.]
MILPTGRAVTLFALAAPSALILLAYDTSLWPWSLDFGVVVLIAVLFDALLAWPGRRMDLKVELPPRLYIGDAGAAVLTLGPAPPLRAGRLTILAEQRGDLDPPTPLAARIDASAETRLELPLIPRRRGRIIVDRIWLRWQGPLGLARIVKRVPVERAIDVVPNVRGAQSAALQFFARDAIYGVKVQQQRGAGSEFDALREFAPGLDHRFIDWKQSAKHRKLLSKEFQTERNHQVVLAFDTGYLMAEPVEGMPRLDHAINAALMLAWISLRSDDLVGLYGFDAVVRQYASPARGMPSFVRLQQATAALDYHHEETNFTLGLAELAARLNKRALVILFTEFVDTVTAELLLESVQRLARRHVLVFVTLKDSLLQKSFDAPPDRFEAVAESVVAHDLLRDRGIVLERLQRLGVHCLDVPSGGLSVGLINRYLMIKQRGLI